MAQLGALDTTLITPFFTAADTVNLKATILVTFHLLSMVPFARLDHSRNHLSAV
jgi:hypothetical protein